MEQERNTEATKLVLRHYWQQILKDWYTAIPALILPGIGSIFVLYVPPLIVARILVTFNHGSRPSAHALLPYVVLFAVIWLIGEITWRIAMYLLVKAEVNGMKRLYIQAMDFLFAKDQSFFNDNFAGSLTKKTIGYGRRYEDVLDVMTFSVTSSVIPILFAVYILWRYSPWLVVALLGMLIITGFIVVPLIKKRQKMVAAREAASNVMAGNVADTISNMSIVRAFATESLEAKRHKENVDDYMLKARRSWDYNTLRIDTTISPLYVLTNTLGLIIALTLSTNGSLNVAAVFVSFSYFTSISGVVWKFNQVYRNLESSISDAAQFTELLIDEPKVKDTGEAMPLAKGQNGDIEFKNVSFQYSDSEGRHLFKNLNLKIKNGEKVALVGHSGGGKTTVTMLLLRFMDIDDGEILINDQNIALVPQRQLRSLIAYVPQDPSLFHRSLADNVRYGNQQASHNEVVKVARWAHADDFIKDLPKGYETMVGERGIKLSGGQRQRIAIARAMLKNAPVLVLDEATSALDSDSEKLIQKALWKLMEGRTAIVIAHRLSTIQRMDRILVLEEGKIVEQGNHKELLAKKNGIYAKLWKHQSGGFLED